MDLYNKLKEDGNIINEEEIKNYYDKIIISSLKENGKQIN